MKTTVSYLKILLCCAMLTWVTNAQAVTLVKDGVPTATLIVEADAPNSLQAAEALQKYVQKMSGATLPLVIEGQELPADAPEGRVHVGHTAAAKGQNVPQGFDPTVRDDAFEEEGYVLRTLNEQTLLIAGNNDGLYRGTVFAAYALLEKLGCRFYFPGDWGEVIPTKSTIEVDKLDIVSRPDFAIRDIPLSGWLRTSKEENATYADWGHKIGFSTSRHYPRSSDGSTGALFPHKQFFEEHPDFYAMSQAGERKAGGMLCLSNTNMIHQLIARLHKGFAGEEKVGGISEEWPDSDGVGFSPPDGTPYCYCTDCAKASENFNYSRYENRPDRPMMSELFFGFAKRLADEFPNKWISTGAYSLREIPPQGIDLPNNVAIWYAPITCDILHPNDSKLWRRRQLVSLLKQWREQTPHVFIYDYAPGFLTGMFVPERDAENMAINAPMYRDMDIKGMRREGRKAFMQTWISYYVTAKLLWDADADLEAIKQDFYPTFFGPEAGPHVRAWWDACAERLVQSQMSAHEDWLVCHLYNQAFTDSIHTHVEKALAAKASSVQRERVQAFALIAENLESFAAMHAALRELDWKSAAAAAGRMEAIKHELHAIYPFFMEPERLGRVRSFFAEGYKELAEKRAAQTDGTTGDLVAELPLNMRFQRDPFNQGVIMRWYMADVDDSGWDQRDTYYLLEQQEKPIDDEGHFYTGYAWYRGEIDVPASFTGREMNLVLGGLINEGWVWVNDKYVGHRSWARWWNHTQHSAEFSIADKLRPGKPNTIAIRVLNDPDEVGGLYRRGFIYAPVIQAE